MKDAGNEERNAQGQRELYSGGSNWESEGGERSERLPVYCRREIVGSARGMKKKSLGLMGGKMRGMREARENYLGEENKRGGTRMLGVAGRRNLLTRIDR